VENFSPLPLEEKLGFREEDRLFVTRLSMGRGRDRAGWISSVELALACYRSVSEGRRITI